MKVPPMMRRTHARSWCGLASMQDSQSADAGWARPLRVAYELPQHSEVTHVL